MTLERKFSIEQSGDNNLEKKKTPEKPVVELLVWTTKKEVVKTVVPELKITFSKEADLTPREKTLIIKILEKLFHEKIPKNTPPEVLEVFITQTLADFRLGIILITEPDIVQKLTGIITTILKKHYDTLAKEIPNS